MEKTLYTIKEVLKCNGGPLPLSRAGAYAAAKNGHLVSIKIGRRVFIPSWVIQELLNNPNQLNQR